MYVPGFNVVGDEAEIRRMVAAVRSGWLVTVGEAGIPTATLLPIMWEGSRIVAHMARANRHWRAIDPEAPALVIVGGPDAYISPSWYPAKAEHGRVVPTWNYTAVHLTGIARVHHEASWVHRAVDELTRLHEGSREASWSITDAPEEFITAQLRAIVGIELDVKGVEAKAKLSQNRSEADRRGVIAGLERETDDRSRAVAAVMQQREDGRPFAEVCPRHEEGLDSNCTHDSLVGRGAGDLLARHGHDLPCRNGARRPSATSERAAACPNDQR